MRFQILIFFILHGVFLAAQNQLGADILDESAGDRNGSSVSLSVDGNYLAVGAILNDGTVSFSNRGHVRVFEWNGTGWTQRGADIDGENTSDQSGFSVSISGDGSRVAISAQLNDGGGTDSGHVRIYEWDGSNWAQIGADIDGESTGEQSGVSVSLSADGNRIAIGSHLNDDAGTNAGQVKVYNWNGSNWQQLGSDLEGEAAEDFSGISVSLSSNGSRVAIGANLNDGAFFGAGHVRVYDWNGTSWVQAGTDLEGEGVNQRFGNAVSLSSDGNRLAVGAPSGGAIAFSGRVQIYEWNGSNWVQLGLNIDGENSGDSAGTSVSLSWNGNRVAIGIPNNDANAQDAGQAKIYEWNGSSWNQLGINLNGDAVGNRFGSAVAISADGGRVAVSTSVGSSAGLARVFGDGPLPVELAGFKAEVIQKGCKLEWVTSSETSNYGFEIEKSINGFDWDNIGFVKGEGTSVQVVSYEFIDSKVWAGNNYYRLKQIDTDGAFKYSEILSIVIEKEMEFNIYPNPNHGIFTISTRDFINTKVTLTDATGKQLWTKAIQNNTEEFTINESGIYFVRIQDGEHMRHEKIMVLK